MFLVNPCNYNTIILSQYFRDSAGVVFEYIKLIMLNFTEIRRQMLWNAVCLRHYGSKLSTTEARGRSLLEPKWRT